MNIAFEDNHLPSLFPSHHHWHYVWWLWSRCRSHSRPAQVFVLVSSGMAGIVWDWSCPLRCVNISESVAVCNGMLKISARNTRLSYLLSTLFLLYVPDVQGQCWCWANFEGTSTKQQRSSKIVTILIVGLFLLRTVQVVCDWYTVWRAFILNGTSGLSALETLLYNDPSALLAATIQTFITIMVLGVADSIIVGSPSK